MMNSQLVQKGRPQQMTPMSGSIPYMDSNGDPNQVFQQYGQVMMGYAPSHNGFVPMVCAPPFYGQWGQQSGQYPEFAASHPMLNDQNFAASMPTYYTIDGHGNYIMIHPTNKNGDSGCESSDSVFSDSANKPPGAGGDAGSVSPSDNVFDNSAPHYAGQNQSQNALYGLRRGAMGMPQSGQRLRNNSTYKTMMCTMFANNGSCNYGARCQYAHGKDELRVVTPHPKFKTQMCNKYNSAGGCQYGDKCHFRHPNDNAQEFSMSMPYGHENPMGRSSSRFERSARTYTKKAEKSLSVYTSKSSVTDHGKGSKALSPSAKGSYMGRQDKDGFLNGFDGHDLLDNLDEKNKECFIKLSMYHHFEVYVGKHRKAGTLKRSNSCNSVGSFTFQRFVAMREIVKAEVNRLKPKKESDFKFLEK